MRHLVMQLREACPDRPYRHELERRARDGPREEWLPRTESNAADLNEYLVEKSVVVELAYEISATDKPDILSCGSFGHRGMNRPHVPADEANVRARNTGKLSSAEYPGWLG